MDKFGKIEEEESSSVTQEKAKRKLPRVERRREKIKKNILEISKNKFASSHPYLVKFETIAEEAEISRATLYSYFDSKEDIIYEIVKPVLEDLIIKYESLLKDINKLSTNQVIERLSEIFIHLWENHQISLVVANKVLDMKKGRLEGLYNRMLELKLKILEKIEKDLKFPKEKIYELLLNIVVPMLKISLDFQDGKKLFKDTLKKIIAK